MAYDRAQTTLRFTDVYNRHKTKQVEMASLDATQGELDAIIIRNAYAGVTLASVDKAVYRGELSFPGAAQAGANIDTGVTVSCQLAGRPEKASNKWPCPDPAIINPDGTLDLTNADVVVIETLYQTAGLNVARISDGEAITGFISGSLDK